MRSENQTDSKSESPHRASENGTSKELSLQCWSSENLGRPLRPTQLASEGAVGLPIVKLVGEDGAVVSVSSEKIKSAGRHALTPDEVTELVELQKKNSGAETQTERQKENVLHARERESLTKDFDAQNMTAENAETMAKNFGSVHVRSELVQQCVKAFKEALTSGAHGFAGEKSPINTGAPEYVREAFMDGNQLGLRLANAELGSDEKIEKLARAYEQQLRATNGSNA